MPTGREQRASDTDIADASMLGKDTAFCAHTPHAQLQIDRYTHFPSSLAHRCDSTYFTKHDTGEHEVYVITEVTSHVRSQPHHCAPKPRLLHRKQGSVRMQACAGKRKSSGLHADFRRSSSSILFAAVSGVAELQRAKCLYLSAVFSPG